MASRYSFAVIILANLGQWPYSVKSAEMMCVTPPRDQIDPDTPLRLETAAALAFPDGSMTASGLRRERNRGRLVVERIAGKDFTTLANIQRMRELCRVGKTVQGSGGTSHAMTAMESLLRPESGTSKTEDTAKALAAARTIGRELRESLKNTSPKNGSSKKRTRQTANVHPLRSL
jgi:hypothetical protein